MIIVLDTGVLGGLANPNPNSVKVLAMKQWAVQMLIVNHTFVIPAIAAYEVRRELLRLGFTSSVIALDLFCVAAPNVYLPLKDTALYRAAQLWATFRNQGKPTAKDAALDGDVILIAQVLEEGYASNAYIVATDNLKHFQGRVNAEEWQNIVP